jgi:hypothetical protein
VGAPSRQRCTRARERILNTARSAVNRWVGCTESENGCWSRGLVSEGNKSHIDFGEACYRGMIKCQLLGTVFSGQKDLIIVSQRNKDFHRVAGGVPRGSQISTQVRRERTLVRRNSKQQTANSTKTPSSADTKNSQNIKTHHQKHQTRTNTNDPSTNRHAHQNPIQDRLPQQCRNVSQSSLLHNLRTDTHSRCTCF